jgi:hypothetical protein
MSARYRLALLAFAALVAAAAGLADRALTAPRATGEVLNSRG